MGTYPANLQRQPMARRQKIAQAFFERFKKDGKAPELDVKAAQCRHFIPLLETLTRENGFQSGSKRQIAIHNVAKYCGRMFDSLEKADKAGIASNGFKFISQSMALEEYAISKDPDDTHTHMEGQAQVSPVTAHIRPNLQRLTS